MHRCIHGCTGAPRFQNRIKNNPLWFFKICRRQNTPLSKLHRVDLSSPSIEHKLTPIHHFEVWNFEGFLAFSSFGDSMVRGLKAQDRVKGSRADLRLQNHRLLHLKDLAAYNGLPPNMRAKRRCHMPGCDLQSSFYCVTCSDVNNPNGIVTLCNPHNKPDSTCFYDHIALNLNA